MRKPNDIIVDRALLVYLLHLAESFGRAQDRPHGLMSDVKLQQLAFLCELKFFDERIRGFHLEFFRYAYGAFSKDLDNDLLSLRRKERLDNFTPTERAAEALKLVEEAAQASEPNGRVIEMLHAVTTTYASQDSDALTKSVEAVTLILPDQPMRNLTIREISFHSTLLVPSRIEVDAAFELSSAMLARLSAALGY